MVNRVTNALMLAALLLIIFPIHGIAASKSEVVYNSQSDLQSLGYKPGTPDGLFGKRTQMAVIAFQREHHLPQTGALDPKTIAQLRSAVTESAQDTMTKPGPAVSEVKPVRRLVRQAKRDPRLDETWGIASPAGCYWECQLSAGCPDSGRKEGTPVDKGTRRGMDAHGLRHQPGWARVCD